MLNGPIGNARLDTTVVTGSALAVSFPDRLLTPGRAWAYPFRLPMPPWAQVLERAAAPKLEMALG